MKILGLIPARGGSKSIPGKNIKLLEGKPLLQYTTEVALKSKHLDRVVLSTDDVEIANTGKLLGVEVPFMRPSKLGLDRTPTLPVIQHALTFFYDKGQKFDAVCLLQVTSPFRTVSFLNEAIELFLERDTDSLITVQKVPHVYHPYWTFKEDKNGNLVGTLVDVENFTRRQDLPNIFHRDGSIYLTKVKTLIKGNSLYGNSISYMESPKEYYANIDTIEDWEHAREVLREMKNNKIHFDR